MKYNRDFLKCDICGNLVGVVENEGVEIYCCNAPMTKLIANTVDAAVEKHLPAIGKDGGELTVTVGEVLHPMTDAHHISWICVARGKRTERMALDKTGVPTATFSIGDDEATVYAYCNLHGLWAVDI